jgi:predicted nucleic acid-binding Zn ribbon protein
VNDGAGPVRIGRLVDAFLEKKGVDAQVKRVGILESWSERVGGPIAEVTRPKSVSEGTLFVEVRSSAWLMELNMMKRDILSRLNDELEEGARIERLVFVQGEG